MRTLLCIDPGTTQSGWVEYYPLNSGRMIGEAGVMENNGLLRVINNNMDRYSTLCIEMIESQGMPVGRETFQTCLWIGRFMQAFGFENTELVTRREVKLYLCGTMRAKDANVRQAVIDMFEPTGGGKTPQIGTKGQPGPLYGVSSHAWNALAVGLTYVGKSGPGR